MNTTLLKSLLAIVPISVLSLGSGILFSKERTLGSSLQLVGAGCLGIVVLTHFCEALHILPWMHWGMCIALVITSISGVPVLGLTFFPVGYLSHALSEQK